MKRIADSYQEKIDVICGRLRANQSGVIDTSLEALLW